MLHKDMMFRFNQDLDIPTPRLVQSHGTDQDNDQVPESESSWLALRVAGNVVAGGMFMAALLAMPIWLDRLMSLI